eukprot:20854-Heterococcus_DN1.PRE.1
MRASLRGALLVSAPLLPVLAAAWQLMQSSNNDAELRQQLLASFGLSLLGFAATVALVPEFTKFLSKKGLTGKDLCKKGMEGGERPIPEATGVIPGTIFLICIIFLQLWFSNHKDKVYDRLPLSAAVHLLHDLPGVQRRCAGPALALQAAAANCCYTAIAVCLQWQY